MVSYANNRPAPLTDLRRSWLLNCLIWASLLFLTYGLLSQVWAYAGRWLLISGGVQILMLGQLWWWLTLNHREGEAILLRSFGLANRLTIVRGLMISFAAGFILSPWPEGGLAWIPGLLYAGSIIIDYFDGYCARLTNRVTVLGGKIDLEFDSLGMLIVTLLAVWYGQLPLWFISLGLAYYLFVAGMWWRRYRQKPVLDLRPSIHRRIFAGFLMVFMSVSLIPILPAEAVTLAGTIYGLAVGIGFIRDWLVVSDRLDPDSATYKRVQHQVFVMASQWVSFLLRGLLAITMVPIVQRLTLLPAASMLTGFTVVVATATILGILSRASALLLLFPLVLDMLFYGIQPSNALALLCANVIILLGSGRASLWRPWAKTFQLWI